MKFVLKGGKMHFAEILKHIDKSITVILSPNLPMIFHDCDQICCTSILQSEYLVNKNFSKILQ